MSFIFMDEDPKDKFDGHWGIGINDTLLTVNEKSKDMMKRHFDILDADLKVKFSLLKI